MKKLSFEQACAQYVHRFTMEHVPAWAKNVRPDGTYYAPQYRSDREWYENTEFPPHALTMSKKDTSCYSSGATWPLGQALSSPFKALRSVAVCLLLACCLFLGACSQAYMCPTYGKVVKSNYRGR